MMKEVISYNVTWDVVQPVDLAKVDRVLCVVIYCSVLEAERSEPISCQLMESDTINHLR